MSLTPSHTSPHQTIFLITQQKVQQQTSNSIKTPSENQTSDCERAGEGGRGEVTLTTFKAHHLPSAPLLTPRPCPCSSCCACVAGIRAAAAGAFSILALNPLTLIQQARLNGVANERGGVFVWLQTNTEESQKSRETPADFQIFPSLSLHVFSRFHILRNFRDVPLRKHSLKHITLLFEGFDLVPGFSIKTS